MAEVTGPGVEEMRLLSLKIRAADPKLKRQLRKRFRDVSNPLVAKVQASILTASHFRTMPSGLPRPGTGKQRPGRTWHKTGSLREEIAKTVRSSVRFTRDGVALDIVSYGSRMPPGKGNLPHHTDVGKGWGHPVFARPAVARGDRVWVREWGEPNWFEGTIARNAGDVKRAAEEAMNDVKHWLE
jgi:hypothetical protein